MTRPAHAGAPTRLLKGAARLGGLVPHLAPSRRRTHVKGWKARRFAAILTISTALVMAVTGTAFAYLAAGGTGTSAAKAKTLTVPGPLSKLAVSTGVYLKWGASGDLPKLTPGPNTDGYWVFRSTTSFTGARLTTTSPDLLANGGCAKTKTEGSKATSCTDTTVTPATTYHYAVEAVYDTWISLPIVDPSITTPSAPTTTTVTSSVAGQGVTLIATVSSSYTRAAPTGTVTFSDKVGGGSYATMSGCSGLALGATSPYQVTCTTSSLTAGSTYTIEATLTSTSTTFAGSSGTTTVTPSLVAPAPAVTSINPSTGPGGAVVTITGKDFETVTKVLFGSLSATFSLNGTAITASTPTEPAGTTTVEVSLVTGSGTSITAGSFKYTPASDAPAPAVTSITPSTGPGGTVVTIAGTDLSAVTDALFGTVPATSFTLTGTTVTVTAPTEPAGTTTVEVSLPTGSGTSITAGSFKYTS
ncbi:MAG: IPT/TIG domain-containing protein [Nitrososphaerales archaeon]